MKTLPIGISTLSTIIEENMVYVDKTEYAYRLADSGGRYFLSRPRRFGKSLFVDTLKSLFEGREELFRGLFIHDTWDWSRTHPVIKVDLSGGSTRDREELELRLKERLAALARSFDVVLTATSVAGKFAELITELVTKVVDVAPGPVGTTDRDAVQEVEPSPTIGRSNAALEQVLRRGYAAKYCGAPGRRVFEVGLVFGRKERGLIQFAWRES